MTDNSFTSNNNKAMLWDMMLSNNMFRGVSSDNFTNVKIMFENVISRLGQGLKEELSKEELLRLNKSAAIEIKNNLEIFKRKNNEDTFDNEKVLIFDRNLQSAKSEFADSIAIKKPIEPNFSLTLDEPIKNDNMSNLLEKLQREREELLPPVKETTQENKIIYTDEKKYYKDDRNNDNTNQEFSINLKKISNIEELLSTTENISVNKRVSFSDSTDNNSLNLNNKNIKNLNEIVSHEYKGEKRINDSNKLNSIFNLLKEIDKKQEEILILLNK